jgi:IS605 OrfB family transposase
MNHNVSKEVVALAAKKRYGVIAMENLRGIRARTKRWNRHANRMLHSWPFGEFQRFVHYKAALKGIEVVLIDPKGTSQECYRCGQKGKRDGVKFVCTNGQTCGKLSDADQNAAKNIAARGAACKPAHESTIGDVLLKHFSRSVESPAL